MEKIRVGVNPLRGSKYNETSRSNLLHGSCDVEYPLRVDLRFFRSSKKTKGGDDYVTTFHSGFDILQVEYIAQDDIDSWESFFERLRSAG